ncbi:hypothetical protein LCGC14_0146700 [marine sediment metagenome]|uniref:Uncharacterized protein n=1 Tax=marine sediment metagenome TaxID=412755 RepID=A0A0F9Y1I4_9ZZZZ
MDFAKVLAALANLVSPTGTKVDIKPGVSVRIDVNALKDNASSLISELRRVPELVDGASHLVLRTHVLTDENCYNLLAVGKLLKLWDIHPGKFHWDENYKIEQHHLPTLINIKLPVSRILNCRGCGSEMGRVDDGHIYLKNKELGLCNLCADSLDPQKPVQTFSAPKKASIPPNISAFVPSAAASANAVAPPQAFLDALNNMNKQ